MSFNRSTGTSSMADVDDEYPFAVGQAFHTRCAKPPTVDPCMPSCALGSTAHVQLAACATHSCRCSRVQTITYANCNPMVCALLTALLLNHSRRHCRSIATSSPVAQRWFDRALCQCFGFNHEEAIRCCSHALIADPDCLMAHW
jgi:hypothetical protein